MVNESPPTRDQLTKERTFYIYRDQYRSNGLGGNNYK